MFSVGVLHSVMLSASGGAFFCERTTFSWSLNGDFMFVNQCTLAIRFTDPVFDFGHPSGGNNLQLVVGLCYVCVPMYQVTINIT